MNTAFAGRVLLVGTQARTVTPNRATALHIIPAALLLFILFGSPAGAQFTGDNQTIIIDGVNIDWQGDYYVGSNTAYDTLLIENGEVGS